MINDWSANDAGVIFTLGWIYPVASDFKYLRNPIYMLSSDNNLNINNTSISFNVNNSSINTNINSTSATLNATECKT